jgi:hypothetical protein
MVFSESAIKDFLAGPAKGKSATAVARESEVEVYVKVLVKFFQCGLEICN